MAKLNVLERVRYASRGGPLDWRVAWVVEGSVEGFSPPVDGIWRRKRAAEAVDARAARVAIENCIAEVFSVVYGGRMIREVAAVLPGSAITMPRDYIRIPPFTPSRLACDIHRYIRVTDNTTPLLAFCVLSHIPNMNLIH